MQIDVRATERLRAKNPVDLGAILQSVTNAVRDSSIDLTRLRITCDWVQYRQNFREIVDVRNIVPSFLQASDGVDIYELAVDMRRAGGVEDFYGLTTSALSRLTNGGSNGNQYLEDWRPGSSSLIWDFNGLYWNALGFWEEATGKEYEQALPGGESDARNSAAAHEIIEGLFKVWDQLAARKALPEDLHILELGVGNGNQAKVWLDEFLRMDREHHGDYYRRLHYLMADYSPHVLERARENVKEHAGRCSSLVLDARVPTQTLGFLRSKAFLIYISNVYDNLPSDEIVRIGGHTYLVEVRAYIAESAVPEIAASIGVKPDELPALTRRLLQLGPELLSQADSAHFPNGPLDAVAFWQKVWDAVRLEERYVAMEELDSYQIGGGVSGEALRPIITAIGDIRMHVSNGAAASFVDSLPLLHPFGQLQCHDIFVTESSQYERSFRGPGKYDGSVVNWVNGPLLAAIGRRHGFEADFVPFVHRSGSNIMTLVARVQE
ncbi:MAG TPA: class I SAM-dependent methyltransferase [Dehalococcoidia bacterium]|nr:class I SAM-dependent methyltransferase [Dehalococcoidia bacterium]